MVRALTPRDDLMHEVDPVPNFNESMYFNLFDPTARIGAFFRLGNRPNEGYAEMTVCAYLPDGRVAFTFARPPIESNERFDAGGMRFAVIEPATKLEIAFDGKLVVLEDPSEMADPKRAFTENPWVAAAARLTYASVAPIHGGEADDGERARVFGGDFARGHYVQHVAARGSVRVGEDEWPIDGFGLRDHSWGPRDWQSPWWYRWLTCNAGAEHGFLVSVIGGRDGARFTGGAMLDDGTYEPILGARIETEWNDADVSHRTLRAIVRTARGEHVISGRVLSLIPLRHRRSAPGGDPQTTRISEGLTEWRWDGHTGYGLSEYLDQMVDGRPVGAAEER